MHVMITGRHIEITPALRRYVETRAKRLDRYGVKMGDVQVILSVEKHRHLAEVVVPVNRAIIQSKVATTEMYASIEQLFDKVGRQIIKRKEKLAERKPRMPRSSPRRERAVESTSVQEVQTVRVPLPALSLEQAVGRLQQQAPSLVIFTDSTTNRLSVLHRLADGSLQLVEPEVS